MTDRERTGHLPRADLGASNTPGPGRSVRTRVVQAAARSEPRGRRAANAQVHVVTPQTADCDAHVARRPKHPAAPGRCMTPRDQLFARRSAGWRPSQSSVRKRFRACVRRCHIGTPLRTLTPPGATGESATFSRGLVRRVKRKELIPARWRLTCLKARYECGSRARATSTAGRRRLVFSQTT